MKKIDSENYIMIIHDDLLLEFLVKKDAVLNDKDMWESKKEAENYLPEKKFYVLLGGEEFFQVTKEAREIAASDEFSGHLAAVALFSTELSLKILGNLYIKINKPTIPTRFFNNKKKAMEWIREIMKK